MASFTNRKGERVEVSNEFIERAIEIKIELQKQSPSGKCSYARLKRMMHSEGFTEADSNESMRQMIKREQDKRGVLPSAKKHADMVADKKLDAIKDAVGDISLRKREAQNRFRELNKLKRDISDTVLFAEAIENAVSEKDFSNHTFEYEPELDKASHKKDMIAVLGDIHYGAIVDVEGRIYNTDIAEELMEQYTDKLIKIGIENNVENMTVMGLGDYIEHLSMRAQNYFSTDKVLSEQITEVSDLIIKMLSKLSSKFKIRYSAIEGNHDRSNGRKKDEIYRDGMVSISNKIIQTYIKYSGNENVKFIEAEPYHHTVSIGSRNFLFVHGDKHNLKKKNILAEQSGIYGVEFDAIIGGHIHNHTIKEVAEDRYVVTFGSIKGTDEYSLKTIGATASRSQGVILIDEDDEFEIKQVKLG